MDSQDHINAINTVLKMGFKGRAARNEYMYLINKIIESKRIEEYKNIQKIRFVQSYKKNLHSETKYYDQQHSGECTQGVHNYCQAILQKPLGSNLYK